MAFLTGWITGPRKIALTEGAKGWPRFKESVQVMLHHELALLLNFGVLWLMQIDQPNHLALCTFALLWFMRLSAKLNLFFGVPQNGAQYLPPHLVYLASYFKTRLITPWFVISITAAGIDHLRRHACFARKGRIGYESLLYFFLRFHSAVM